MKLIRDENFKSLGFKDMHGEQIDVLMKLMNMAAHNAKALDDHLKTELEDSHLRTMQDQLNDVMIIFGGTGVTIADDEDK
jgi:molybdopterin biosynthesis enzyme MoaB